MLQTTRRAAHGLSVALVCFFLSTSPVALANDLDASRYLEGARRFADCVIQNGQDTYGKEQTPLFVDGLNTHTHGPVKWISLKGDWQTATGTGEWILSNFAAQQTLLRILDGIVLTANDARIRALETTRGKVFDNRRIA